VRVEKQEWANSAGRLTPPKQNGYFFLTIVYPDNWLKFPHNVNTPRQFTIKTPKQDVRQHHCLTDRFVKNYHMVVTGIYCPTRQVFV